MLSRLPPPMAISHMPRPLWRQPPQLMETSPTLWSPWQQTLLRMMCSSRPSSGMSSRAAMHTATRPHQFTQLATRCSQAPGRQALLLGALRLRHACSILADCQAASPRANHLPQDSVMRALRLGHPAACLHCPWPPTIGYHKYCSPSAEQFVVPAHAAPHTTAGCLQFPSKNGRASPGELSPSGKLVKPDVETFDIEQGNGVVEEQRRTFARAVSFGEVTTCLALHQSAQRSAPTALGPTCPQINTLTNALPTLCVLHAANMLSVACLCAFQRLRNCGIGAAAVCNPQKAAPH